MHEKKKINHEHAKREVEIPRIHPRNAMHAHPHANTHWNPPNMFSL